MLHIDVLSCFAVSGAGALLGLGLLGTLRTELPRVRQALVLHRWAFVFLLGLGAGPLLPEAWRSCGLKLGIVSDLVGVAMVGWAMRQLNGRRTHPALAIGTIAALGLAVAASGLGGPRLFVLAYALGFFLVSLAITIDQGWLVIVSPRVSVSEAALLVVVILFTLNWLLTLAYALNDTQPISADWMVSPTWLQPWSALSYALLPLTVAAVTMSTLNERLMQQIKTRALTDDLTGALSRRGLREMGERLVAIKANKPRLVAVLMIDADHFKRINQELGHQAGDAVLRHLTAVLRERLRTDALLCRYNGPEFCILLPVNELHEAHVVAERLRTAVEGAPWASRQGPLRLTVSIGLAFQRENADLDDALARADRCLREAKGAGRNRIVVDASV